MRTTARALLRCLCATFCIVTIHGLAAVQSTDAPLKTLRGHVPEAVRHLTPKENLPGTNQLRLAIGLPLRDPVGLDAFLAQVYDPASPNYRQYLTVAEFTARFGPTEADYSAVADFAHRNNLTVTASHQNRLVLDVAGAVADIQNAFHITLR